MCWTCHRTLQQKFKGTSSYNKCVIKHRTNPEQCYYTVGVCPELIGSTEEFKHMDEKDASVCQSMFLLRIQRKTEL